MQMMVLASFDLSFDRGHLRPVRGGVAPTAFRALETFDVAFYGVTRFLPVFHGDQNGAPMIDPDSYLLHDVTSTLILP
jgi:hypothetical protein